MSFLRKYATGAGADIYVPIVKRAVVDFAVGADFTPAAGDVKISIDGAAAANIGTLPVAVAMGNGAVWKFVFTNAELTGKYIVVTVVDAATKAVEDQSFVIETYGNASALHPFDLGTANVTLAAATHTGAVIPTVTNLTNLPSIPANWLTAAGIAAAALNGKGDWNIGKTGYALSAAGEDSIVDKTWDEVLSAAAHNVANSAGRRLRLVSALTDLDGAVNDAAPTATSFVTNLTSAVDQFYRDRLFVFTSGALAGQSRPITTYNGTTKVVTFDEGFTSAPANTDAFTVVSEHVHSQTNLINAVWDELTSEGRVAGSFGQLFKDNINATVSSRAIPGDLMGLANDAITAAKIATDAFGALELATDAANEIRDAVWAKVVEAQGSYTAQQVQSILLAVLAGVTATGGSVLKTPDGLATRVTATLDASDNRTAMTLAPSS